MWGVREGGWMMGLVEVWLICQMSRLDDAIVVVAPIVLLLLLLLLLLFVLLAALSSFSCACRFIASLLQLFIRIYFKCNHPIYGLFHAYSQFP